MKEENKIKQLEKQIIDLKIKQHTKSYIHIPLSWSFIGVLFAFLGSVGLAILNFILIISIGNVNKVWTLFSSANPKQEYHSFSQLIILYPLVGEYILISLSLICLVALIKGGFNKLKSIKEDGLISGLICGLIGGLILGLILGLIFGLIGGLILGLIGGLTGEIN